MSAKGGGSGSGGRVKKKKESFVKCYTCGSIGHKSNACTVEKSSLSCTHCQTTSSHNMAALAGRKTETNRNKSLPLHPHTETDHSLLLGGKRSQTPAASALSSNNATIIHNLNRVSVKIHKMDVRDKAYKVNLSSSASGKLRTMVAITICRQNWQNHPRKR